MAIEVGFRYPQPLAGVISLSGYVCEPEKLVTELSPVAFQQRLLVTHGTVDPMGSTTAAWFQWGTNTAYGSNTASVSPDAEEARDPTPLALARVGYGRRRAAVERRAPSTP